MKVEKIKTAKDLMKELDNAGTKDRAISSARYFKTGKGEYGEGDIFIGVTVPETRRISKKYLKLSFVEIQKMLDSKIHEHRLSGLMILTEQMNKTKSVAERKKVYDFYIKNLSRVNNWDLVDTSAPKISGRYLHEINKPEFLYKFCKSKDLWTRRVGVVSTLYFISKNDFKPTLKISKLLLKDEHDLMHKACGWMLREGGKKISKSVLTKFIEENIESMPRTMLRYAIEHYSHVDRKKFLAIPRNLK